MVSAALYSTYKRAVAVSSELIRRSQPFCFACGVMIFFSRLRVTLRANAFCQVGLALLSRRTAFDFQGGRVDASSRVRTL